MYANFRKIPTKTEGGVDFCSNIKNLRKTHINLLVLSRERMYKMSKDSDQTVKE